MFIEKVGNRRKEDERSIRLMMGVYKVLMGWNIK